MVAAAADADPQRKVAPLFLETASRLRLQLTISASSDAAMFPESRSWIKNRQQKTEKAASFPAIHQEMFPLLGLCLAGLLVFKLEGHTAAG